MFFSTFTEKSRRAIRTGWAGPLVPSNQRAAWTDWLRRAAQSASSFLIFFERALVQSQPPNPGIYVAGGAGSGLENERNTSGTQTAQHRNPPAHTSHLELLVSPGKTLPLLSQDPGTPQARHTCSKFIFFKKEYRLIKSGFYNRSKQAFCLGAFYDVTARLWWRWEQR